MHSTIPARPARSAQLSDRFLGSDPGLTRLLTALQGVVSIGAAMAVEWLFVRHTHVLQLDTHGAVLPGAQAAEVAAQHHGVLIVAVLLGAIVGMISSFTGRLFPTARAQLVAFSLMPVPMVAGMALGLALAPHRSLALVSFVVVLGAGGYCRRFGPPGFVGGMLLFMGDFFGYLLSQQLRPSNLGWLAVELWIGALVAIAAQLTVFYPGRRSALRRMRRSYSARARELATAALAVFDGAGDRVRASRRLHRRLVRLNETALMVDSQLSSPGALPVGLAPATLHQRLFDAELALANVARFADRLAHEELAPPVRDLVRTGLAAVADHDLERAELAGRQLVEMLRPAGPGTGYVGRHTSGDRPERTVRVVLHRFAISILGSVDAARSWAAEAPAVGDPRGAVAAFESSVTLNGGWLPGSTGVSAVASREDRIGLAPYARVAIQLTVAATGAVLLGSLLSERRFYWAVLAAFLTFMGTNNTGEQVRKGLQRVAGTMVGILLGATAAHLVGQRTGLAITVILLAMFLGLYFMRVNYALMVIGVTVAVSQLYVQLDEFSDALLVTRLEENAIGVAVAALTVLFVFPLRPGRVVAVAVRQYVDALSELAGQAVRRLLDGGGDTGDLGDSDNLGDYGDPGDSGDVGDRALRTAARRLDGAHQSLVATTATGRLLVGPDTPRYRLVAAVSASRHYARMLVIDTAAAAELAPPVRADLVAAGRQLGDSLAAVVSALVHHDGDRRTYVRSAALFDLAAGGLDDADLTAPPRLALRDLQLIDGAMAVVAGAVGLRVRALDTPDDVATEHRSVGDARYRPAAVEPAVHPG